MTPSARVCPDRSFFLLFGSVLLVFTGGCRAPTQVTVEVITDVPRLVLRLGGDWAGTELELPPGRWRDEFTGAVVDGGRHPLSDLLCRFPVSLLVRV